MDIRRFRIFQKAAELKSFTKAANELYMTQPAVSKAIMELEEELGTPLFERFPKKVVLTPEGTVFLERINGLLTHYDDVITQAATIKEASCLRIGSGITVGNDALPAMIEELNKRFPDMQIQVEIASSAQIMEKVRQQKLDIAFVEGVIAQEDVICIPVSTYHILPVASPAFLKEHPIQNVQQLSLQPLLLREEGSAIRSVVDSAFLLHDTHVTPCWTSTNSTVLLKAAVEGFGVAFLPEKMIYKKQKQKRLETVIVDDFVLENVNHIVYLKHKHLNDAMYSLIEIAKSYK